MYIKNCVTENFSIFLLPRIKTGINQQLKGLKVISLWAFVNKNQSMDEIIQAERKSKCFKRYFPLKRKKSASRWREGANQFMTFLSFFLSVTGEIYENYDCCIRKSHFITSKTRSTEEEFLPLLRLKPQGCPQEMTKQRCPEHSVRTQGEAEHPADPLYPIT